MTKHKPIFGRVFFAPVCFAMSTSVALIAQAQEVHIAPQEAIPVADAVRIEDTEPSKEKRNRFFEKIGDKLFRKRNQSLQTSELAPTAAGYEVDLNNAVPRAPDNQKTEQITRHEKDATTALEIVYQIVFDQTEKFNAPELQVSNLNGIAMVPNDFSAIWREKLNDSFWPEQTKVNRNLDQIYSGALNSTRVHAFARIPQVQDAVIQEARSLFGTEIFGQSDVGHTDEPTGSILTTGQTGRFLQDSIEGEYGIRKRLGTGAEVQLSQRLSTLANNSEFLDPNPQSGSELVFSVAQPLLRGAGQDYVRSEIRIAEIDRNIAATEYLRLVEEYLLEVNRAYWGVYLSRAAWLQRKNLLQITSEVVEQLEERQKLDDTATVSELFRAKAALNRRKTDVQRTKMAVRTSEQRLRALLKDPEIPLGASAELIPATPPELMPPMEDVQDVAAEALQNRPEMIQASMRVRSTAVRRSQALAELKPQLDLVGEVGYAGLGEGRDIKGALDDLNDHGTEWRVGVRYSMPIGNEMYKARYERRDLEFQQSLDEYQIQGEAVLLESLIAYQDLLTAYQDMSGKYQSVLASRKEIVQIDDRMNLNEEEAGKSIAYQLQLQLNAMDRNQIAEEEFIVSIVTYNTAIASLHRAKGVMLEVKSSPK